MKRYWALDYVDEHECELVVDGQLYETEEEAYQARSQKPHPECYDVTWYLTGDLKDDVFDGSEIRITPDLKVEVVI